MTALDTDTERGATAGGPAAPEADRGATWLAPLAVALGVFTFVTSEILPVGLLTPIADGLAVSEGRAGLMVTVPGLAAAISAPILTVATARADRRKVLMILSLLVVGANIVSAVSSAFGAILAARLLVGIATGGFWSIAGGIAPRIAPQGKTSKAIALVYGGSGAAAVAGVPLVTILGDAFGWRAAFWAVAGLAGLAFLGLLAFVPKLPSTGSVRFRALPDLIRTNKGVRFGGLLTALFVGSHFIAYTYVRPVLQDEGITAAQVGMLLLVYGVAGLTGNGLAAVIIDKSLKGTLYLIAGSLAGAMVGMALIPVNLGTAAATMVLWGLAFGLLSPAVQTWYLRAAPEAAEVSTAINTFFFNLSIAVASFAGGLLVDDLVVTSVLWAGAALAGAGALTAWIGSARTGLGGSARRSDALAEV
ncbi:MFS transporter [Salininema proteolyticum]|uniref:MFS transporter n=1 Tax=Salininema proteolyticum TaxID=1607685 RepID=A0ABV8TV66_9ACTN